MRYNIFSLHDNDFFNIDTIGYGENTNVTHFGPGKRNLYIIHYVLSGKGYFNGHSVEQGQGFLIYPNMYEHYFPDKKNPWKFLWIISEDKNMVKLFKEYNANKLTNVFEYSNVFDLVEIKNMIIANNNKFYGSTKIAEIFLSIFNNCKKQTINRKKTEDIYFDHCVQYIKTNVYRRLKVEELVKILGISQSYIYKIFMKKCGMSPQKYIMNLKIEQAKALLTSSDMTVTEVASSVGYEDALNFSKIFKAYTGASPTQFLKLNKK